MSIIRRTSADADGAAREDLPASIRELDDQLAALHRDHPSSELTDATHLMTAMLHIAVHGSTWARPETPRQVWLGLLADVLRTQNPRGSDTPRASKRD